ncbi:MAG: hypothetical protein JO340_16080 [Acidobacteriaceae bacterium]|nr:hypothetical protein [Acidobacteriaceae bacterium]
MINDAGEQFRKQLDEALGHGGGPKAARFALACLGAIPGIGGAIAGIAGSWSEQEQAEFNKIFAAWLKLQEDEIREIGLTIFEVMSRLDQNDEEIRKRVESPEYLRLVKKCFRDWSAAESEEKRRLIRNLLSNAAATKICPDDVISMFITWIDNYSESHFAVIREIFKAPGTTRQEIWNAIHGAAVRENSAEADLFKLLIHDLSTGHVIRQHRPVDYYGRFIKQEPKRRSGPPSQVLTSAFDDEKQYELTELGKQFVHYTMNEIVPRIAAASAASAAPDNNSA